MFSVGKEMSYCANRDSVRKLFIAKFASMTVTKFLIAKVNPFYPVFSFYTPESIRKPTGFSFSRGIEKEHCLKLGNNHWDATVINKTKSKLLYQCDFCLSLIFYVHNNFYF